jgi:hypothetical protein
VPLVYSKRVTQSARASTGLPTVTAAVPDCPSTVAVSVASPTSRAVTLSLAAGIDATSDADVVHPTVRPVSTLPRRSRATAVTRARWNCGSVTAAGSTDTDATGCTVTRTGQVASRPPTAAWIPTVPGASATTSPAASTVATPGASELHATGRPSSGSPAESRATATRRVVSSTAIESAPESVTVATGTGITATVMLSAARSLYAATTTVCPVSCAVTTPSSLTVAIRGSSDAQRMWSSLSFSLPLRLSRTASSESVVPPRAPGSAPGVRSMSTASPGGRTTPLLEGAGLGARGARSPVHAARAVSAATAAAMAGRAAERRTACGWSTDGGTGGSLWGIEAGSPARGRWNAQRAPVRTAAQSPR